MSAEALTKSSDAMAAALIGIQSTSVELAARGTWKRSKAKDAVPSPHELPVPKAEARAEKIPAHAWVWRARALQGPCAIRSMS